MENLLIWVDEADQVVGYGEKIESHRLGQLHRAFSVFIYDNKTGKMLIQRRALDKYHSGGLWSNACCSHPYKEESWRHAFVRAMSDELGIAPDEEQMKVFEESAKQSAVEEKGLYPTGTFHYYVRYGELAEHEMDHVFVYYPAQDVIENIKPVPAEVDSIQWLTLEEIDRWLGAHPEQFSNWFPKAYALARTFILENE